MATHSPSVAVDLNSMATPPRFIAPGRTVHLTIRAVTRQHRFAPSPEVVESIEYIFWHCADEFGISIHETTWMSNHAHIVLTDEEGVLPKFVCKLNSLISRQLNAIRGLKGTNIEKGYVDQEIIGEEAMLRMCAYTLANPCAAGLVSTATAWRGVTTVNRSYGEKFEVPRPNCGMWKNSTSLGGGSLPRYRTSRAKGGASRKSKSARKKASRMPAKATGVLVRPRVCMHRSDRELRAQIRARTKHLEAKAAAQRLKSGQEVLGWKKVARMKWNRVAASFEAVFKKIPKLATSCIEDKTSHGERIARFRTRHQKALDIYRNQSPKRALFPLESWKMKTIYNARYDRFPT